MPGPAPTLTHEDAAAAVAAHGGIRAAARALGVDDRTVRRALARPPAPRPRIRYAPPQLDTLDALLGAARGAVARGDLLAACTALDRATRTTDLLRLAVTNVDT